jgi:thiosulfate/3-mercaptopyruvate sulfurtransferase
MVQSTTISLDASWHMPNSPRSAMAEYLSGPRLPHARRWDLDAVAELAGAKNPLNLTHMLPSKERFVEECREFCSGPLVLPALASLRVDSRYRQCNISY